MTQEQSPTMHTEHLQVETYLQLYGVRTTGTYTHITLERIG